MGKMKLKKHYRIVKIGNSFDLERRRFGIWRKVWIHDTHGHHGTDSLIKLRDTGNSIYLDAVIASLKKPRKQIRRFVR